MAKEFKSILVASAATGIGVMRETDKLTFSDLQMFYSHVLGYPIWTHEMATGPIMSMAQLKIRELYPDIPTKEFCADKPREAAQAVVDFYGETVMVPEGKDERPTDPITTLMQMRGDKETGIIVIDPKKPE